MKKRQIKKNNQTAVKLLMLLDPRHYEERFFGYENGIWEFWYQSGGLEPEWDCIPAFDELHRYVFDSCAECDVEFKDGEPSLVWRNAPDLSTAKKVFDLAKQLVGKSVGGGV